MDQKTESLVCLYTNADSLPNKIVELRTRLDLLEEKPDIIAVTEAKPKNRRFALQPCDYLIQGYLPFTCNLEKDGTRGVIIWLKSEMDAVHLDQGFAYQESLWLDISLIGGDHLLCICVYRSPSASVDESELINS